MLSNYYLSKTYQTTTFNDVIFNTKNVLHRRQKFKSLRVLSPRTKQKVSFFVFLYFDRPYSNNDF